MERGANVIYCPRSVSSPPRARTRSHWWDSGSFTNIEAVWRIGATLVRSLSIGTWDVAADLTVIAYTYGAVEHPL